MVMSFLYYYGGTETNEAIHRGKWMSTESGGMVEIMSLHFIYTYVFCS